MAAESPSSASEKPPIEKLGLGPLITDPITSTEQVVEIQHSASSQNALDWESDAPPKGAAEMMADAVEVSAATDEEAELRNVIERDLCKLTIEQAEIETARERLEGVGGWEETKDVAAVKKENPDDGKDVKDVESVEDENENEGGDRENGWNVGGNSGENEWNAGGNSGENEWNAGGNSEDAAMKLGRYNQINNRRRVNYPMRPDAEDCAFYMKSGSCKFGLNCKFNHPPRRKNQGVKERVNREENSERAAQTECKYYLTSGGCKYGKDCKYFHGSDKGSTMQIPEFNFLGLPIRPGEKECPYYMRTGSCKYGSNCRFHHPEPTAVAGGDSPSGYGNGGSFPSQVVPSSSVSLWSSPRAFNDSSPFVPVIFPPTQGAPTSNPEWNGYPAATYPTSERSLPTPPAFAMNNLPTEMSFPVQHQRDMVVEEYPERPGEPECGFFLKTGDCKFKSNCKFDHPKNRISKTKANSCALNDKGLPLRPDQPICTHYHRYGICKFGPACRYDHPANLPTPFDQQTFGNSNMVDGGAVLGKGNES